VEGRLDRLGGIDAGGAHGAAALELVRGEMREIFRQIREKVGNAEVRLDDADRRISPSDFGFHNALAAGDRLRFIDFEYAGWDDPAKMVCDFFCQPAVPAPMRFYESFARAVAEDMTDPARHLERFALLLPLYRLKWCCIMLNEFLPVGDQRRSFAREDEDQAQRRGRQLQKVREALSQIQL
jgi:hypothetical protein